MNVMKDVVAKTCISTRRTSIVTFAQAKDIVSGLWPWPSALPAHGQQDMAQFLRAHSSAEEFSQYTTPEDERFSVYIHTHVVKYTHVIVLVDRRIFCAKLRAAGSAINAGYLVSSLRALLFVWCHCGLSSRYAARTESISQLYRDEIKDAYRRRRWGLLRGIYRTRGQKLTLTTHISPITNAPRRKRTGGLTAWSPTPSSSQTSE